MDLSEIDLLSWMSRFTLIHRAICPSKLFTSDTQTHTHLFYITDSDSFPQLPTRNACLGIEAVFRIEVCLMVCNHFRKIARYEQEPSLWWECCLIGLQAPIPGAKHCIVGKRQSCFPNHLLPHFWANSVTDYAEHTLPFSYITKNKRSLVTIINYH